MKNLNKLIEPKKRHVLIHYIQTSKQIYFISNNGAPLLLFHC